jgi:hypothetical protein
MMPLFFESIRSPEHFFANEEPRQKNDGMEK